MCDHSLESCLAVLFFFSVVNPVCNFGKFINFELGSIRSEKVNVTAMGVKRTVLILSTPSLLAAISASNA